MSISVKQIIHLNKKRVEMLILEEIKKQGMDVFAYRMIPRIELNFGKNKEGSAFEFKGIDMLIGEDSNERV